MPFLLAIAAAVGLFVLFVLFLKIVVALLGLVIALVLGVFVYFLAEKLVGKGR